MAQGKFVAYYRVSTERTLVREFVVGLQALAMELSVAHQHNAEPEWSPLVEVL